MTRAGDVIRLARESLGMSQERLAALTGEEQPAVSRRERTAKRLTPAVAERYAAALDIPASDLIGDSEPGASRTFERRLAALEQEVSLLREVERGWERRLRQLESLEAAEVRACSPTDRDDHRTGAPE